MKTPSFVYMKIHGMPCVNRCWHCCCNGSPDTPMISAKKLRYALERARELQAQTGAAVFPQFYAEPTLHEDMVGILKRQLELGLAPDDFWFTTNGHGLTKLSAEHWKELAAVGFSGVRLTFHGMRHDHDRLVGRDGAYDDLVTTIRRCEEHGIEWLAGMMISPENAGQFAETRAIVESLGSPCVQFGWMIPNWQGRAANDEVRVTVDDLFLLPDRSPMWQAEGDLVKSILEDEELAEKPVFDPECGSLMLDVDPNLDVYLSGGCDGNPFDAIRSGVFLGKLRKEGFLPLIVHYLADLPEPVRLLARTTQGDLARKYGDPRGRQVFHMADLVGGKWASRLLEDAYGGGV